MSCVSKPLEEEEQGTQSKIELHDHVDIPVHYASLESVYSVSFSSSSLCCISAAGSHKKVNAQKHSMTDAFQGYGRADGFELRPHRRPEIVHVYCRRKRRRRRRRRESFVELEIAQNEGVERNDKIVKTESTELEEEEEETKNKPKRRRIGNGELMKLGLDSTTLSISDTPGLRGCRIKVVCSGSKQNGSSRRKKIDENVGLGGSFDSIGESGWIDDVTYMMLMSFLNFR